MDATAIAIDFLVQCSSDNKRKRSIMPLRVYLHICLITGAACCFSFNKVVSESMQ